MCYMHKIVLLAGMWTMLRYHYLPSNAWTPSFCVEINEKAGPDVVQGTTRMCCRAYCRAKCRAYKKGGTTTPRHIGRISSVRSFRLSPTRCGWQITINNAKFAQFWYCGRWNVQNSVRLSNTQHLKTIHVNLIKSWLDMCKGSTTTVVTPSLGTNK